jgi:hypothetical protein
VRSVIISWSVISQGTQILAVESTVYIIDIQSCIACHLFALLFKCSCWVFVFVFVGVTGPHVSSSPLGPERLHQIRDQEDNIDRTETMAKSSTPCSAYSTPLNLDHRAL